MTRPIPIIPEAILRRHKVAERYDNRFRAAARLLQSRYREALALPIGIHTAADGATRKLGSRLTLKDGDAGFNFLTPEVAVVAVLANLYREPGATIDEERLMTNLLSSQPLVFNALGPLHLNLDLATAMLGSIFPELADATVDAVLFEHSPGRGDDTLTGDHTAWDAAITYVRADGTRGIVAIEVKYSENGWEPAQELRPRYAELMPATGLFIDPTAPQLRARPIQQLMREHVLLQAAIMRGDYAEGRFLVIAPEQNGPMQSACRRYGAELTNDPTKARYVSYTLEAFIEALSRHGDEDYAGGLYRRYCDWSVVHREIEECASAGLSR
jgi:hypothetical protein